MFGKSDSISNKRIIGSRYLDQALVSYNPFIFSTFYGLTQMKIIIGYIFALYATKMGSKDSGETKSDLIGSRTCLGPSVDPTMALKYTQHGPLYIDYIFALYATN